MYARNADIMCIKLRWKNLRDFVRKPKRTKADENEQKRMKTFTVNFHLKLKILN